MELGGSDAYAILADCDLDQAATAVVDARVANTGQTCIAPKRCIVEKSVKVRMLFGGRGGCVFYFLLVGAGRKFELCDEIPILEEDAGSMLLVVSSFCEWLVDFERIEWKERRFQNLDLQILVHGVFLKKYRKLNFGK